MRHIDVSLNENEYTQAASRAEEAGVSVSAWIRDLIQSATQPQYPADRLFGILAAETDLADAIDAVVSERSDRVLRVS